MPTIVTDTVPSPDPASLDREALVGLVRTNVATIGALTHQVTTLQHQLDWFKRQLFGSKTERSEGVAA